MFNSFCPGALCAKRTTLFLALICLFSIGPHAARGDVAGQQAAGSANYPNGGLNFIGDMNVASFAGNDGLYAFAVDPTTDYALTGSSANVLPTLLGDGVAGHGDSLLSKIKLNAGGAVPTVVDYTTSYHDGPATFGNIAGAVSMAIDTGSGLNKLSDHYAYVGGSSNINNGGLSNGGKIMKVQLFPPDANFPNGDPGAAPKVVSVYSLSGSPGFAAAVDDNYAYFLSGTHITRIDLHLADNDPNKMTTITGLPNLVYYKADIVNSGGSDMLYVQALGAGVVEINVAAANVKNTNGVLTLNSGPTVLPYSSSSPGTFAADATQPYAYIGGGVPNNTTYAHYTATTFQSSFSKVVLSGPNIGAVTAVSPLPVLPTFVPADPVNVPAGQTDRTGLSLAAIDPDSHAIIVGTDNNLPGNVLKFSSGGNSDLAGPIFAGAVQMPYNAAFYQNMDPVLKQDTFPYRVGDINMRDVGIDPKAGYVYFGTDTNIPHLLQVQYSQKGSIKGNKVTLPAAAHLTSVNFYANMPAQPSATSTGNIRLAIYSDTGGMPSGLLWQSSEIPTQNIPANGGWLSVTGGLPTIQSPGDYWLAWQADTTLDLPSDTQGTTGYGFTVPEAYGTFPASIPIAPPPGASAGLALTSDSWSMNVVFNTSLPGDFNGNGHVDVADYVYWRKNDGTPAGYQAWRSNFGNSANAAGAAVSEVPEPRALLLLFAGSILLTLRLCIARRRIILGNASIALAALGLLACDAPSASAQLTFNITNNGTASSQMMTGFTQAGALWSAYLKDPTTINIRVGSSALPAGVIGHSDIYYDSYAYTNVRTAMLNDRLSLDDFSSTDALQPAPAFSMLINRTANNPDGVVSLTPYFDTGLGGPGQAGPENNSTVRMPAANAKALGLSSYDPTLLDGIITFTNSAIFDFDRSNGIAANKIDFVGVAAHEIGHVLGFTSGVDILVGNGAPPGLNDNQLKFVTPLDLFRFTSRSIGAGGGVGVIDWTGDDTDKYFSVDGGVTPLANFSNGTTYEEGHWQDDSGIGIMDPTAGVGELLKISDMDVRAMDVIGYNRVAAALAGDFNFDGVVDAADYPVWRKADGTQASYYVWRDHFGQNSSSSAASGASTAVPEPASQVILIMGILAVIPRRRAAAS